MATLQDFLPLVAVHCTNAPTPAMESAVRSAAIEFCRKTLCHQVTLAPFNTVVDQREYTLAPGTGLQPAKLLACRVNGQRMRLLTPAEFDAMPSVDATSGTPEAVWLSGTSRLSLYRTPALVAPVEIRMALEPTQAAATIADDVFFEHAESIAYGAAQRLAMTPEGRDERLAAAMSAMFEDAVGRVAARTYFNRSRSGPRTTPTWC